MRTSSVRVVSLIASSTEIVCALGLEATLVGREWATPGLSSFAFALSSQPPQSPRRDAPRRGPRQ